MAIRVKKSNNIGQQRTTYNNKKKHVMHELVMNWMPEGLFYVVMVVLNFDKKKIKNRFAWEKGGKRRKKRQGAGKKVEKGEHGDSNNI